MLMFSVCQHTAVDSRRGLGVGIHGYRASCFVWVAWLHFFTGADRIAHKPEFIVSACYLFVAQEIANDVGFMVMSVHF